MSNATSTITNLVMVNATTTNATTTTLYASGAVAFAGLTATTTIGTSVCISNTNQLTTRAATTDCAGQSSSLRYKEDITSLSDASGLQEVLALRPVSFKYRADYLGGFADDPNWSSEHVGFIAEEVQQVDPRLIVINSIGQPETMQYQNLTAVLVKAIQELSLRLDTVTGVATTSNADSQSFASNFFGNIFNKITGWLADATNGIGNIFAGTFRAKEKICVDDQCLTKDDIRTLLQMKDDQLIITPTSTPTLLPPAPIIEPTPAPIIEPQPEAGPPGAETATSTATSTPIIEPTPQPEAGPPGAGTTTPPVIPIIEEPIVASTTTPAPETITPLPEPILPPEPVPTLPASVPEPASESPSIPPQP